MERASLPQLVVYAAAAIAIAVVGALYLTKSDRPAARPAHPSQPPALKRSSPRVVVDVTGAVRRPGVYRLPSWARLELAVERAGGPAPGADLVAVNLAAKVADGQQVVVPRKVGAGQAAGAGSAQPAGPISLNTATPDELDKLDGVGPATAQKILDWRKQHGGFRSTEDLKQIGGIGPKRFEALKDKVRM